MQLLDLDGSNVRVTHDGSTTRLEGTVAKLSIAAAQALNQGGCSIVEARATSRPRGVGDEVGRCALDLVTDVLTPRSWIELIKERLTPGQ